MVEEEKKEPEKKEEIKEPEKKEEKPEEKSKLEEQKGASLEDIKRMMEEVLKDIQKKDSGKETATKKEEEIKTKTTEEVESTEPTGNKIEVDLLSGHYIFQVPDDWTETDKAKLNILITESIEQKKPLILDKAIKVFEINRNKKEN